MVNKEPLKNQKVVDRITLVLADGYEVVRRGLRALLESESDIQIVGEADNERSVINLVEELHPDILLVDPQMGGMTGLGLTKYIAKRICETSVIFYAIELNEIRVKDALMAGAKGYVLKESTSTELVEAIRKVAAGHRYLSQPLLDRAIDIFGATSKIGNLDPYNALSFREREIFSLVAQNISSKEIAKRLNIGFRTVETHRLNLRRKLGLHNQAEVLHYANRVGFHPSVSVT